LARAAALVLLLPACLLAWRGGLTGDERAALVARMVRDRRVR
jgi:hypothetical protein